MAMQNLNHPKIKYLEEFIIKKDPKEDYKLIKNIGSGTYGEVYKAIHRRNNTVSAVKIVKVDIKDDIKAIAQEIHTLRDCNHKNIVKYFGSYLRKNKLWICMEFCGGFSIQDIYTNIRRPLEENCIAYVTRDTLDGLAYMHKQGKIHRDIKGANILLTEDGQVKIADFGVAAQITQTIQKRCSFIGTPYWEGSKVLMVYPFIEHKGHISIIGLSSAWNSRFCRTFQAMDHRMAPEVAAVERKGGYDEKCDIWAVGITAIEYAELQPPMFDLHPMKALHLLSMRNYKAPVLQNKTKWSQKFHSFLKICLNKNEKRRPDAMTLLQHDFVTQKNLTISLTKHLLQVNRNPGRVPLVPNDDDDDDDDGGENHMDGNGKGTIKHQQKHDHKPLERIQSTRRVDHHSCLEDVRFQITQVEAPICEPENTYTMQNSEVFIGNSKHNKENNIPMSPVSVRNEEAEAFNAYHDTSPEDKVSEVVYGLVNDNQRLRFAQKFMWLTGSESQISNQHSNPPTPPPKRASHPPPIPPLPISRKFVSDINLKNENSEYQNNVKPRRNSSVDLGEDEDLLKTPVNRRFSQIEIPMETSLMMRPIPPLPDSSAFFPPPVPPRNPRTVSPSKVKRSNSKNSDENSKSSKDENSENQNLYDINRRKAIGVGLPPTPKVPMGACFSLIFEGCPLKINATATWIHPLKNDQIILFGTNEGIYYISLDELAEGSLTMLFPRRCLWLYVVKNTMMSLSGQHPQLYNHNLIILFKLKTRNTSINSEKFSKLKKILPRRFIPTTKVPDTKGCLLVSVTRNPYSGAKYLCAALTREILIMEWFNPVFSFMEVKRISTHSLPTPLLNFDLLIFEGKSLPLVCLGVYPTETSNYEFHLLDLDQSTDDNENSSVIDCQPPNKEMLTVVKMVQLEVKVVLIAFQNKIVITNLKGRMKTSRSKACEMDFNFIIQSIVCLNDSILAFHQNGLCGMGFNGQLTQEINDESNIYRLIGSDKNIVVEKRSISDPMNDSNIYILAGHTDTS